MFSRLKQALALSSTQVPLKKSRDALQARTVCLLIDEIMQQMRAPQTPPNERWFARFVTSRPDDRAVPSTASITMVLNLPGSDEFSDVKPNGVAVNLDAQLSAFQSHPPLLSCFR